MNLEIANVDHRRSGPNRRQAPKGACAFPECDKRSKARGLCNGHYRQWAAGEELRPLKAYHRVKDGEKYCSGCDTTKPLSEFGQQAKRQTYRCKSCINIDLRCKTYGLTREEVVAMIQTPCAACGRLELNLKKIHIDHNHGSGVVRGVLCHACNTALGLVMENPATLRALADYIEHHS